jgi:hypothetical protein
MAALFAGLAVGIAAGLAWPEPDPPRSEAIRRLEAAVTIHSGRADGHAIRTHCTPVRGSDSDYSCFVVQSELGSGIGIYYSARIDWKTGRFRFSRFDVPLYWGV